MSDFRTYITQTGFGLERDAKFNNTHVNLAVLVVGDGVLPDSSSPAEQTDLIHQVREYALTIEKDDNDPNVWIARGEIPASDGGFFIKEAGVKTKDGYLYTYARQAGDYKPLLSEGQGKSYTIRLKFVPGNADVIQIKIDPSVQFATPKDLENLKKEHTEDKDPHSQYETHEGASAKANSALSSAKNYTDSKAAETLNSAKSDASTKANSALSSAKNYTDSKAAETLSSAKSDASTKTNSALSSAKSYADSKTVEALNSAKLDASTKANNALSSAKSYSDGKATETLNYAKSDASTKANNALSGAKSYADGKATETLDSAKSDASTKANSALTGAKNYADGKATETLNSAKSDASTKANSALTGAKSYADSKATEALNSAKAFASDAGNITKGTMSLSRLPVSSGSMNSLSGHLLKHGDYGNGAAILLDKQDILQAALPQGHFYAYTNPINPPPVPDPLGWFVTRYGIGTSSTSAFVEARGAVHGRVFTNIRPGGTGNTFQGWKEVLSTGVMSFVGMIVSFPTLKTPKGFLKLQDGELSRAAYRELFEFALLSGNMAASEASKEPGQFGPGNGSTTFTLPNPQGLILRVLDESGAIDAGRTIGSYQADDFKSHQHEQPYGGSAQAGNDNGGAPIGTATGYGTGRRESPVLATGGIETRPKNIAWPMYIKY